MAGKEFPLAIVIRTMDKSTAGFDKVTSNLDKVGKKMAKIGKSMSMSVTAPILGIGIAATKALGDFEQGMSNVATLVDTSVVSMDDMGRAVRKIGKDVPVAFNDLTAGLYSTISAGVSAADAIGVLDQSARLAVAGLSSTDEAVNIVTSSLNSFNLKGDEAAGVYDVLFTAVKHGKTDLSQLGVGFGAVAGKMADAGIKFDEYIASVSAMTTTGLPAAQAHTQMRAAIDGLTKSSKPLSKIFKKLGTKDFKSLIKESGGVVPAMQKIRDAVGGSEAEMRKLIGSSEGSAAVMSVTGTTYEAFAETLADMRDGISEVATAFEKQNNTQAASWQRTKNSLTSAAISIGTVLAPALEKLATKLQAVVGWFEGLDTGTKETIVTIAGVAAVVGPSLIAFGKLASAVGAVSNAMKVMSVIMAANPIGLAVIGIAAGALLIMTEWGPITEFFGELWDLVTGDFESAEKLISSIVDKIVASARRVTGVASMLPGVGGIAGLVGGGSSTQNMARAAMKAKNASDKAASAMQGRTPVASGYEPGAASSNHVMVEFVGAPSDMRVKSVKGGGKVDVKTGYQGY